MKQIWAYVPTSGDQRYTVWVKASEVETADAYAAVNGLARARPFLIEMHWLTSRALHADVELP